MILSIIVRVATYSTTNGSKVNLNIIEETFLCFINISFSIDNLYLKYSSNNILMVRNLGSL